MFEKRIIQSLLIGLMAIGSWSCQKKGDFIDEDRLGTGIYYYPTILNKSYYDTLSKKAFGDTTFSPGQKIAFQLKYGAQAQDTIATVELWAAKTGKKAQKIWSVAYDSSFYSELQQCDTTFILVKIPENIDSTVRFFNLYPKVVTQKGLETQSSIRLQLVH